MKDLAHVEAVIARMTGGARRRPSRQATRELAINPILAALGWDVLDPDMVQRKHPVHGGTVDYRLNAGDGAGMLVEAHARGASLAGHEDRICKHAKAEGGNTIAVLSDGERWEVFAPAKGTMVRVLEVDLRTENPADAAQRLEGRLGFEAVRTGEGFEIPAEQARAAGEGEIIDTAWRQVTGPRWRKVARVIETEARRAGHATPTRARVKAFVQRLHPGEGQPAKDEGTTPRIGETGPAQEAMKFQIGNEECQARNMFGVLLEVTRRLATGQVAGFLEATGEIRGKKSPYWSLERGDLRRAVAVPETDPDLFVEGNVNNTTAEKIAHEAIEAMHGAKKKLGVERARTDKHDNAGKRPTGFRIDGRRWETGSWRGVLIGVCEEMAKECGEAFTAKVENIAGPKRAYFSEDRGMLHGPVAIPGTKVFVDTKQNAASTARIAARVVAAVRGEGAELQIDTVEREQRYGGKE